MGDHFPTSFRPNEPSTAKITERAWLQGVFLAASAYGTLLVFCLMSFISLWQYRSSGGKKNLFFRIYTIAIFLFSTVYIASILQFTQEVFIDERNVPGGPAALGDLMISFPVRVDLLSNTLIMLNTWLCDAINLWRCFVVYKGCRVPSWAVNTFPGLLYLGSIVSGIITLKQVGDVDLRQLPQAAVKFHFSDLYYPLSPALNIVITILIVLRLLVYRWRLTKVMGPGQGSHYASTITMIIESATIYSVFSIPFIVTFVMGNSLSQLFIQGFPPVQSISTMLIIFRVATGKSWSHDTYRAEMSSLVFTAPISSSGRAMEEPTLSPQLRKIESLNGDSINVEITNIVENEKRILVQ